MLNAIVVNYRGGRHTQSTTQYILEVKGIASKEDANKLMGKNVTWKSTAGKAIKGKILATHGAKGAVRARFEKGLPGQAMGTKATVAA